MDDRSTTWKLTSTTQDAWQMMLKAIDSAKESIYMEQFLFEPDAIGQEFLNLFIKKAQQGVTVKLLLDSMYSLGLGQSLYLDALHDAGVKVKFFNWLLPFSKHNKKFLYFRDHRRLLVIDRKIMLTGGVCIGKTMEDWRETQIQVEGPVADQAAFVFDKSWRSVYKKRSLNLGNQYKTGLDGFSYITHAPFIGERHVYHRLIDAIRQARKYVYITTPYFLPDRRLERVLILAKKRGVDVRIIIPENSNHRLVNYASHTYFYKILSKDIPIYRHKIMVHAKTTCIDDEWATVGTMNLDNISLRYNFESALIITQPLCISELREQFMKDLKHSDELTLKEWEKRPLWMKVREILIWPLRKLL